MNNKKLYKIAINDADYVITPNGVMCKYFSTWKSMITRCYSSKLHVRYPTYEKCTVCKDWLSFMNFRSWMMKQDWKEKELDKDILNIGNKIYSPETCIFVSKQINYLLGNNAAVRGAYPQGCYFNKEKRLFQTNISINGKRKYLGRFTTWQEAEKVYLKAKYKNIMRIALEQTDVRITEGLKRHASILFSPF